MSEHQILGTVFGGEEEDPYPGQGTAGYAGELPGPAAAGEDERMTLPQQLLGALINGIRQGARQFREVRNRKGSFVHGWFTYDPPSVEQQIAYRDGRSWVPVGYEGGGIDKIGTRFQNWVAIPGIAILNAVIWHLSRGTRVAIASVITGMVTFITLIIWVVTQIVH